MLDQLVESRSQSEERTKLGGFMLSTGFVLVTVLTIGLVISLFSQNIALGAEAFEISGLVAPVPIEPKPEPVIEQRPETSAEKNQSIVPQRRDDILRIEENPSKIPDSISVTPSNVKARPNTTFKIGNSDIDPKGAGSNRNTNGTGIGGDPDVIGGHNAKVVKLPETKDEPPVIKKPEITPPTVSGGVVNGKAKNLVTPVYSAAAKNLGIRGEVKVQVLIDEEGNVISANAVSGHPLLKASAVNAAKASKFTPTTLSKQKVKVTGFIIYNFA